MKRKLLFVAIITILIGFMITIYTWNKSSDNSNRIVVKGIENFSPKIEGPEEDRYLLFYPADPRTSQSFTLVKEVSITGEVLKEYEIRDNQFFRMEIHQKPNEINQLYVSFFGAAAIDNWFYTYDIDQRKFKKVNLTYFNYDVGVDHIKHFGQDVLFQTNVSHRTGDQNTNEDNQFNMSISNFSREKSYETEYGYPPNWSPLLQLGEKIIYAGNGQVNDEGIADQAFIGIIDSQNESVEYTNFNKQSTEFYPLYAKENQAYIIGNYGKLFIINKDGDYKTYEPFKELPPQSFYYKIEGGGTLLLNEEAALHSVYNESSGTTLGLLSFKEKPTFTVLDKDYIKKENSYRLLYQDINKQEIYLLETDGEKHGNLLVLDNHSFDLVHKIPVDYEYLLDFVIKK
ncbi:hypothetical protein V7149_06125 [Bacillus sp. JJ1503]|uniref:hypothetical protein n=1 Tax=unclassified Bacillus (in: firmicutes) TaxID=185979 RepID=UPI002FFF807D